MECLLDADTSWMARWHGVPPELISHCKTVKQAAATVIKAGLYGRDGKPEGGRSEYDASRTLAASFLQWRKQDDAKRHENERLFSLWRIVRPGTPPSEIERYLLLGRGLNGVTGESADNARWLKNHYLAHPWKLFIPLECPSQCSERVGRSPHSSPHFALASFGMNTPAFDTASAKFCISGASLCSGMFGMRS
jgi:hypothetical protein